MKDMRGGRGGWRMSLGNYYPPSSSLLLSDKGEEEEEVKMTSEEENNNESECDEVVENQEVDMPKLAKGFYEIEGIRKKRIHKGQPQYLIKWRDWPESSNTWEPIGNLGYCSELIKAFEHRSFRPSKKGKCKHKPGSSHTPFRKKKHLTTVSTSFATQPSSNGPCNSDSTEGIQAETFSVQVADDLPAETGYSENRVGENQYKETNEANPQSSQEKLPDEVNAGNFSIQMADTGVSKKDDQPKDVNQTRGAKRRKSGCVSRFNPNSELPEPAHQSPAPEPSEKAASDNSPTIVKILKCLSYRYSVLASGNTPLRVTFRALRSDGKEVDVDNTFLTDNYPKLLIDYYEKRIWKDHAA